MPCVARAYVGGSHAMEASREKSRARALAGEYVGMCYAWCACVALVIVVICMCGECVGDRLSNVLLLLFSSRSFLLLLSSHPLLRAFRSIPFDAFVFRMELRRFLPAALRLLLMAKALRRRQECLYNRLGNRPLLEQKGCTL